MARVLLLGENALLLKTRAAVLRRTGAEVLSATPDEVLSDGKIDGIDALILCHTVPPHTREELTSALRQRWPGIRVIQLVRFDYESNSAEQHADTVAVSGNPAELIASTTAIFPGNGFTDSAAKMRPRQSSPS
jgi:DNA-binding response OmpR family regulator